jgi:hypothetical protein
MDTIIIKGTSTTPLVIFDAVEGILEIKGVSILENSIAFYRPLLEGLDIYISGPVSPVVVNIHLDYFNTSSSKSILDVLKRLKLLYEKGSGVTVNWYYDKEDQDMEEVGINYQAIINLPFNMKPILSVTTGKA